MRQPLSVRWLTKARADLARINAWSQDDADMLTERVEKLSEGGWTHLGRPIPGSKTHRWLTVRPYAIVYWVRGRELRVVRLRVPRRMRRPVP